MKSPEEQERLREYMRKWRAANVSKCTEYTNRYRAKDPERWKNYRKQWVENNKERAAEVIRSWNKANPQSNKAAVKRYKQNHPERVVATRRSYLTRNRDKVNANARKRAATDPQFRITRTLRARIWHAVVNQSAKKCGKTMELTGCSRTFLMEHLQSKFRDGMHWNNYGPVWHIDHIKPCAKFDLTQESEQLACFHYSNLQPLFAKENRVKHATFPNNTNT